MNASYHKLKDHKNANPQNAKIVVSGKIISKKEILEKPEIQPRSIRNPIRKGQKVEISFFRPSNIQAIQIALTSEDSASRWIRGGRDEEQKGVVFFHVPTAPEYCLRILARDQRIHASLMHHPPKGETRKMENVVDKGVGGHLEWWIVSGVEQWNEEGTRKILVIRGPWKWADE